MYICICNGITDQQIKEAIEEGATSFEALQMKLGVGTNCGMCTELTASYLPSNKKSQVALPNATNLLAMENISN